MPGRIMKWSGILTAVVGLSLATIGSAWAQTNVDLTAGVLSVQNPRRIAEGPEGQVLVTDRRFGTVVAVGRDDLLPVWSAQLPQEGAPFGLAMLKKSVFVGNTKTKKVEVYKISGTGGADVSLHFAFNLGDRSSDQAGSIENPIGIAVDRNSKLVFVLDGASKSIGVFRHNGAFLYGFQPMDADGAVLSPVSVTVDEIRREILVGDYGNPRPDWSGCSFCGAAAPARILIYDYEGQLLFQITGDGSTHLSARFARVQGMATSAEGRIFAADPLGNRILVFDRVSGALVEELGSEGSEPGQLMLPLDVWLDGDTGDLFISNNRGARRVEVLRGVGE